MPSSGIKPTRTRESLTHVAASGEQESLERLSTEYEALSQSECKRVRDELERAAASLVRLRRKLGAIDGPASG